MCQLASFIFLMISDTILVNIETGKLTLFRVLRVLDMLRKICSTIDKLLSHNIQLVSHAVHVTCIYMSNKPGIKSGDFPFIFTTATSLGLETN